jgi:hypothetical protein
MTRRLIALVAAVVLAALVGAVAYAEPVFYWFPFRLVSFSAIDVGAGAAGRYGVALVDDRLTQDLCLAIVTDRVTGVFTAASVPAEACRR